MTAPKPLQFDPACVLLSQQIGNPKLERMEQRLAAQDAEQGEVEGRYHGQRCQRRTRHSGTA
jgi:hypothetical protein